MGRPLVGRSFSRPTLLCQVAKLAQHEFLSNCLFPVCGLLRFAAWMGKQKVVSRPLGSE